MRSLYFSAFAVVFTLFAPLSAPLHAQVGDVPTLTITGQGSHETAPDMAMIRIGVTTQAKSAGEALSANNAQMARATQQLKAAGVEARDLQTSNLSLQPLWNSRKSGSNDAPEIIGFVARNTLSVRVRDLAGLGEVLDASVRAVANEFHGLSFGLSDPVPAADKAREAAVADALRKARVLAGAAGVALGPILSISEHGGGRVQPMDMARAAMAEAVPIEAGEMSVDASVTMVFALN